MRSLIAFILLALLGTANADLPSPAFQGSRINLDAQASEEVNNDVMRAALFVEMEDIDAKKLADTVNRIINDSLKIAKGFTRLRVKTSGYNTYPLTDSNKIERWRSRSEISIEDEDFRAMAEAIGKLQNIMKLGFVNFSVSPATRAKTEDALIQRAIAEFLRRAEVIQKEFKSLNGSKTNPDKSLSFASPSCSFPVFPKWILHARRVLRRATHVG